MYYGKIKLCKKKRNPDAENAGDQEPLLQNEDVENNFDADAEVDNDVQVNGENDDNDAILPPGNLNNNPDNMDDVRLLDDHGH